MIKESKCRVPGSDQWITCMGSLAKKYEDKSKNPRDNLLHSSSNPHLSFIQITKKLMFSQRMSSNIVGTIKGKFLLESDLPPELVKAVGHQLGWELHKESPERNQVVRKNKTPATSAKDNISFVDSESRKSANPYEDFLQRMDDLDEGEGIEEIAGSAGLLTGLKSWLNFGSSVVQNAMTDTELKKVYLMGVLEPGEENNVIKSSRGPARTDDKLTRKAEERTSRIANEFCAWLRSLPLGDDESINNTPESQIKALFDTTQSANPNKSKLAEGLKFWAKFGEQATGASLLSRDTDSVMKGSKKWGTIIPKQVLKRTNQGRDMASIASSQIAKKKFKKKVRMMKRKRLMKLMKIEREEEEGVSDYSEKEAQGIRAKPFNHKEYGVWFMKPETWEKRFKDKRDVSKFTALHNELLNEKSSWKEDPLKSVSLAKLDSTKAFAEFLKKRKTNYDTSKFLRNILNQSMN